MTCLLQSLASDLKGVVPDPKLNRPGEMKRAMSSIFGASTENSSSSTFEAKQFPSSSLEGIKRLKNNLQESSTKARDRAKTFDAACSMIDKFWHLKRKRSRIGYPSNVRATGLYQGANIPKTGIQSYASGSGLEIGSQREEKSKIGVPSRRIRTSLLEMDVQTNGTTRMSGPLERDKDMLKSINGSATQLVENDGAFSADGWERSKLKKKRSVIKSDASTSSGLSRSSQGGEREVKRGIQHKLGIDARPRINHAHSFRPGLDGSTTMVGNSDTIPQHVPSMRSRNELNNASLQNDKRDVRFCPDTENASLKVITKPNSKEDRCGASPSFLKFASFRTRTNPGSLPKTSGNIHRVVGNQEDMELPQATEKLNALGVSNRKRAASVRSSSPPVGQWAVQRPKKFSRSSRRSSLSPLVPSHDELVVPETMDEASIHHDSLGEARHASLSASQQSKVTSASLSESEESGVQENKLKCKVNKCTEMEDKSGQTVQKSANLIMASRKNRMAVEEDAGDGDRRQGRIGRCFAPTRSGLSATIEKHGEAVTAKQQRSVRHGSERVESKPDRPHIKKLSERKAYTRPKQSINILSMESSEESADDQEELLAAATAALDTGRACSSSLWKQLEAVFRFVSSEDVDFLLEQIQLTNASAARTHADGDNSQNLKVDHEHVTISSGPVVTNTWKSTNLSNGISSYECEKERGFTKDTVNADPLLNSGVSLCQALLSAIIGEEDMENICSTVDHGGGYSYEDCNSAQFELDKGLKSKVLNLQLLEDSQAARRTSDCYKVDANWRFCDEISTERSGTNGFMDTYNRPISSFQQAPRQLVPMQSTPFSTACNEFHYNQMSINDRLILELSEIGLYPEVEHVPDLTYGEDEDITEGIRILEEKLNGQANNRKGLLLKLEKAVMDAKELQKRRLEWLAMDRLVQIAYDRYMACWGPSASGTKNVNKVAKHATMAFVKRALARFEKLKETGISCFNQPIFRDILSASSRSGNSQTIDIPANDHNTFMASQIARKVDTHAKCSNAAQEHPFSEDDHWSNRVKKKEVFLDDVAGSTVPSSRTPGLGNSLISGAKGKRSERDRDGKGHNRDSAFKNGTAKIGRPATSSGTKSGERKNKSKPKIKTTQLSASVNVLHGKNSELLASTGLSLIQKSSGFGGQEAEKKDNQSLLPGSGTKKISNDSEPVDLTNLQLPDIDVGDFGGQGQDIASWLNFEDEGLQDHGDCMGLEIPMDDLSDVHMMI
ncbi:hypothetical protein M5K25_006490 [Dendrobium thyrsiflorum]|uniref:Uncharacterized protein n=1 Tax=Dendrobium thyrsiflorum TaxID=117978 RepID=A0ABD0VBR4_DENTH